MTHNLALKTTTANALRRVARDQNIKGYIESNGVLSNILLKAARRYIGGIKRAECLEQVQNINTSGHAATIDYMGEATKNLEEVAKETQEFLSLIDDIDRLKLNSSISLDLSHIGLDISLDTAYEHARSLAKALKNINKEMIISMEGSERTDLILAVYKKLCLSFDNVGITLQARLHRTAVDLPEMLKLPGKIRLVKGAYEESRHHALDISDIRLETVYKEYAKTLMLSGKRVSIGTHDANIYSDLKEFIQQHHIQNNSFEFEVLAGLGNEQINSMRNNGYSTRIYFVYGNQWYLYVCHRIAEQPERLYQALIDIIGEAPSNFDNPKFDKSSLFPYR